jgi:MFS transporter, ACS family, glucarate transporter
VGEAAALPNSNKIVAHWVGEARRGAANSIFLMGVGIGGTVTPPLITWIMRRWGWPMSFYISAILGIALALVWLGYATNRPEQHPSVNSEEMRIIRGGHPSPDSQFQKKNPEPANPPWRKFLSNASTWGLMLSYFCEGYPNYIFYTWFFLYLVRVRGMSVSQGGIWGAAPFFAVMVLAPVGGSFSDYAVARFGKRRGRQTAACLGMACSAILLTLGAHTPANILAVVFLSGAMGMNIFATSTYWAACNDLTPNFSASLSSMMNMWGNIGGWLSPILTAIIATRLGWTAALDFAALITFTAALLWILIDANQNLEV